MESENMQRLYLRSVAERSVRYMNCVRDANSKTFMHVSTLQPYGKGSVIQKIQGVGHVQKRMGTRLRKLKSQTQHTKLSEGKTIGGKERLTEEFIKKVPIFYGNAIRANKYELFNMRKRTQTIWMYYISTDQDPQYFFCPKDENTLCKYYLAAHKNNLKTFQHKGSIAKPVVEAKKPVFQDQSHPDLLRKCLGGRTQNANESLNSFIQKYCPKSSNDSKTVAEIATLIAVFTYNNGKSAITKVMNSLRTGVSESTADILIAKNKNMIREAEDRSKAVSCETRKAKKLKLPKTQTKLLFTGETSQKTFDIKNS